MVRDRADRSRPGQKSILVVVPAVVVEIADEAELARVAFPNQVLPKNIRDVDLLIARIELVQVRIGVLLAHVEGGEIVLPAIVVVIAEKADAEIGVVKNKTAKVAD